MAQDQKPEDSVYDFLYVDLKRIAQFSSQLNQYGHLTGLTRSVSETSSSTGSLGVSQTKIDKVAAEQIGQVRQFDPQWLNPLTFLDDLNRRNIISRDVRNADNGQFILATGQLCLFDLEMLRSAWDMPNIKSHIKAGVPSTQSVTSENRHDRRASAKKGKIELPSEFDVFMDLLKIVPHGLQIRLIGNGVSIWSTLENQFLNGNRGDLILKHGSLIGGEWNILGIKDADWYDPNHVYDDNEQEGDIVANIAGTAVGQLAARVGVLARNISGRPGNATGVTPILIFRETGGRTDL